MWIDTTEAATEASLLFKIAEGRLYFCFKSRVKGLGISYVVGWSFASASDSAQLVHTWSQGAESETESEEKGKRPRQCESALKFPNIYQIRASRSCTCYIFMVRGKVARLVVAVVSECKSNRIDCLLETKKMQQHNSFWNNFIKSQFYSQLKSKLFSESEGVVNFCVLYLITCTRRINFELLEKLKKINYPFRVVSLYINNINSEFNGAWSYIKNNSRLKESLFTKVILSYSLLSPPSKDQSHWQTL